MLGAYMIIGANAALIFLLHEREKGGSDIDWGLVKIGLIGEVTYALWKFAGKLLIFL